MDDAQEKERGGDVNLDIIGLKQGYGNRTVLQDISFSIGSNEMVAVLGPNGSGKSTLIKTVCRIKQPLDGSIMLDGEDLLSIDRRRFSKTVGYVPQKYAPSDYMQVFDAVLIGRAPYMEWSYSDEDFEMAAKATEMMGIDDLIEKNIHDLSGGQIQKVIIARAIAQDPKFYILDEPTSALDLMNQMETMSSMRRIMAARGAGVLVALHDINLAMRFTDRVIMLKDGAVYASGKPEDVITEKSLSDVYGISSEIVEGRDGLYVHVCGGVRNV